MSQHDYNIDNGTGLQVRTEFNVGLLPAIVTQNSGPVAPSPTFPYMRWADTTTGMMKMMRGANDGVWITLYQLDGEWNSLAVENGSVTAPSIYFKGSGTDTGIYSSAADTIDIATAGVNRFSISSSGAVSIPTNDLTIQEVTVGRGPGAGATITNTVLGRQAHQSNVSGANNTAIGFSALRDNLTGSTNTAVGSACLQNCEASGNTGVGNQALQTLQTGDGNTAVGVAALYITTGAYNIGLGGVAGGSISSGSGNIVIGSYTSSGTYSPAFTISTQNNRISMGTSAITDAYIQVSWTVVSDARDKTNFSPVPHGLEFVNQLQPTAFHFKLDRDSEEPHGPLRYGFKAQDILALEGENSVIIDNEDPEKLRYKGEALVPVLVNAINELTSMVKDLQAEVAQLQSA
jgi:hypothetical protein